MPIVLPGDVSSNVPGAAAAESGGAVATPPSRGPAAAAKKTDQKVTGPAPGASVCLPWARGRDHVSWWRRDAQASAGVEDDRLARGGV